MDHATAQFDENKLVDFDVKGVRFQLLDPDNSVAAETLSGHIYEPATTSLLVQYLKSGQKVFVDVGAHYGYFTCFVGKLNPQARIYAFEPGADSAGILDFNIRKNALSAQIFDTALTEDKGRTTFAGRTIEPATQAAQSSTVATNSLDNVLKGLGVQPDVIKIDVHGAEGRVIGGMTETLRRFEGVLIVEIHGNHLLVGYNHGEIFDMLSDQDLHIYECLNHRAQEALQPRLLSSKHIEDFKDPASWSEEQNKLERLIVATRSPLQVPQISN